MCLNLFYQLSPVWLIIPFMFITLDTTRWKFYIMSENITLLFYHLCTENLLHHTFFWDTRYFCQRSNDRASSEFWIFSIFTYKATIEYPIPFTIWVFNQMNFIVRDCCGKKGFHSGMRQVDCSQNSMFRIIGCK